VLGALNSHRSGWRHHRILYNVPARRVLEEIITGQAPAPPSLAAVWDLVLSEALKSGVLGGVEGHLVHATDVDHPTKPKAASPATGASVTLSGQVVEEFARAKGGAEPPADSEIAQIPPATWLEGSSPAPRKETRGP
jgi:hypothetical protein